MSQFSLGVSTGTLACRASGDGSRNSDSQANLSTCPATLSLEVEGSQTGMVWALFQGSPFTIIFPRLAHLEPFLENIRHQTNFTLVGFNVISFWVGLEGDLSFKPILLMKK